MAQSQYAQISDLSTLAITAAVAARFGDTAMTAALQAASSIADSYIASQFVLPLALSPQGWDMSLTLATVNIAAYLLYCQFGFNPAAPADKLIVERYERALAWLKLIADKTIFPQWVDSSPDAVGADRANQFINSDPPVGFTGRSCDYLNGAPGDWASWDFVFQTRGCW